MNNDELLNTLTGMIDSGKPSGEICHVLEGKQIYFPRMSKTEIEERNERIRMLYSSGGYTYAELAARFYLSESQIKRIMRKL